MSIKLFIIVILFLLQGFMPQAVFGHAFPDHSEPKVGATVEYPPKLIRIWFDGALEPVFSTISVKDSEGNIVDRGDGRVNPSDVTILEVSLPALSPGIYRVIWNVVARDGHRTMGDYTFEIK